MLIDSLLSIIAPHSCVGCAQEGSILCAECIEDMVQWLPGRCYRCRALSTTSRLCESCRPSSNLRYCWTASSYEGVVVEVIRALKYEHAASTAQTAARIIAHALPALSPNEWIVMPVPTANQRVRERGYDQAVLIAKELARILHCDYYQPLLRTTKHRQVGTKRTERMQYMQIPPFRLVRTAAPKNSNILLVDDVVTTGATIESAAAVLRTAGFRSVSAAAVARA